ncbi:MAG: hypothetical protein ACREQY_14530 [Candidatus Binatia bacterium]
MSTRLKRFLPAAVIAAVVALAVVIVPLVSLDRPPPEPTPEPGVSVTVGETTFVPDAPPEVRDAVTAELSRFAETLYERAFVAPEVLPEATEAPEPSPSPEERIADLFTEPARSALHDRPEVFDPGPTVVGNGRVSIAGAVTLRDNAPTEALLEVDFTATGRAADETLVDIHQLGQLFCVRTEAGWRVGGFDLHIEAEPVPSPSPTAEAG